MKWPRPIAGGRPRAPTRTPAARRSIRPAAVVFIHGALQRPQRLDTAGALVRAPRPWRAGADLPGHGRSGGAALNSVEAMADWLLALLDAAGVGSAALVGHSMGSLIALEAAARAPGGRAQLVMVGTAYPMAVSPTLLEAAPATRRRAIGSVKHSSHSTHRRQAILARARLLAARRNRALMRRVQAGDRRATCSSPTSAPAMPTRGGLEAAARSRCPTTLVVGRATR